MAASYLHEDQIQIEEIKNEVNSLLYILYNIYKEKYGNNISLIKSSSTTSSSSFYKSPLEISKVEKRQQLVLQIIQQI